MGFLISKAKAWDRLKSSLKLRLRLRLSLRTYPHNTDTFSVQKCPRYKTPIFQVFWMKQKTRLIGFLLHSKKPIKQVFFNLEKTTLPPMDFIRKNPWVGFIPCQPCPQGVGLTKERLSQKLCGTFWAVEQSNEEISLKFKDEMRGEIHTCNVHN